MIRAFSLAVLLFAAPAIAAAGMERAGGLIIMDSAHAPAETAERFRSAVTEKGATVIATVDHAAAAEKAGLDLPPTVAVIFGNPKVGTPLMQLAPTMAADLPLRALFWEENGVSRAAVLDPQALAARHGLAPDHERIVKVEGALTGFLRTAVSD